MVGGVRVGVVEGVRSHIRVFLDEFSRYRVKNRVSKILTKMLVLNPQNTGDSAKPPGKV